MRELVAYICVSNSAGHRASGFLAMVYCPKCGTVNPTGTLICRMCEEVLVTTDPGLDALLEDHPLTVVLPVIPESNPTPTPVRETPVGERAAQPHQSQPEANSGQVVYCAACGHADSIGSAFCSSCGAPRLVPQTVVMTVVQPPPKGHLRLIGEGGKSSIVFELKDETVIGRQKGDITFANDGFMSESHARIERRGDDFVLIDQGSRNGIYLMVRGEVKLSPGDFIFIGRQLFNFKI